MSKEFIRKQLLIAVAALSLCLSACGSPSGNQDAKAAQETKAEKETEKETIETTAAETEAAETSIEEQVLYEQDGVTITVTGMDFEGSYMGCEINLLIENDSEKNLTVQARNISVNGYMVEVMMSSDVAAGKKNKDTLTILNSSLEECDIKDIADMEFSFHIFNSDAWDDSVDTEMISLKTSCADTYTQSYDDSGDVIYEDDNVKIVSKGLVSDSIFGVGVKLYMENKTEDNITIQSRDTSADGFMVDTIFSQEIVAGKRAISSLILVDSEDEELNPASVETSFHIFMTDGWDTIVDTEPITIEF